MLYIFFIQGYWYNIDIGDLQYLKFDSSKVNSETIDDAISYTLILEKSKYGEAKRDSIVTRNLNRKSLSIR